MQVSFYLTGSLSRLLHPALFEKLVVQMLSH